MQDFFRIFRLNGAIGSQSAEISGQWRPVERGMKESVRLLDGDRVGELDRKTVFIGPNDRAAGFEVLLPGEGQNNWIAGGRRRFTPDKYPFGADVMDKFTVDFLVDHIIDRNHAFPSIIGTSGGHENMTCMFHDEGPRLLTNQPGASPFAP